MNILQIIGLPCSGKSFLIKNLIKKNKDSIIWLDIANYYNGYSNFIESLDTLVKEIEYFNSIDIYKNKLFIIESATGFYQFNKYNNFVIKIDSDPILFEINHKKRKLVLDEDLKNYYFYLKYLFIKHNLEINTSLLYNEEKIKIIFEDAIKKAFPICFE